MRAKPPPPKRWHDFDRSPMDVVICPGCRRVNRPAHGSGPHAVYRCCGSLRVVQGRTNKQLPTDFWDRYGYGDTAHKSLAPPDEPAMDTPDR